MSQRRSIILDGKTTSIAVEEVFWQELERLSRARQMTWQDFLRQLLQERPAVPNRAAAVKEAILYLIKQESRPIAVELTAWWEVSHKFGSKIIKTNGFRAIVGRGPDADIYIDDKEVSRKHSLLVWDNELWWVVDLNSKNGTFMGGKKIKAAHIKKNQSFHAGRAEIKMLKHF